MAQEEVQNWLNTLRGTAQDIHSGTQANIETGQQEAKAKYVQNIRQNLIDTGMKSTDADVLASGVETGDQKIIEGLQGMFAKRLFPNPKEMALSSDQLSTHPALSRLDKKLKPEDITALASMPRDQQDKAISEMVSMNTAAGKLGLGEKNLSFREQSKNFQDPFNKRKANLETFVTKHDDAISAGQDALDKLNQGSQAAGAAALGYLVKATGERVNEQAVKRFMTTTMPGTTTTWQNYFDGGANTPMTKPQIDSLKTAFQSSIGILKQRKEQEINTALGDVTGLQGSQQDGALHPSIQKLAKRYGRTYNSETDSFESPTVVSELKGDYGKAMGAVNKITDPNKKMVLQRAIKDYHDRGIPIPANRLKQLGVGQ